MLDRMVVTWTRNHLKRSLAMSLSLELPIGLMLLTKRFGDQGGLIERYLLVFQMRMDGNRF